MKIISKEIPFITSFLKREGFVQLLKYILVGGLCTVLDFLLLYILVNYLDINYLVSSVISFMSGTFLNYFLCVNWIFDVRVVRKKHQELLYYILITGVGLGINTSLIWIFTEFAGFYFMISKIVAVFVTFWWNFCARKYFLHS